MTQDEKLAIALGALAEIAFSEDVTISAARKKAARIYRELTAE